MKHDFLAPETPQIRHQLNNIIDSYNNDWDILAELAQNSIDAINKKKPTKGHLHLTVYADERFIEIEDNGTGIDPEILPKLLAPFSTDKSGSVQQIGNKGVGITFVIFSSKSFSVESHHASGSRRASINDAAAWLKSDAMARPELLVEEIPASEPSTKVRVTFDSDADVPLFDWSFEQLKYVLLTRTALGDTNTIWGATSKSDFVLTHRSKDGVDTEEEIECAYLLPTEPLKEGSYISLRDFQQWLKDGDRSDSQKREKLRDKLVYFESQVVRAGRTIRYWSCFVPKRKVWDIISAKQGILPEEALELSPTDRAERYDDVEILFSGGVYTSTRGMPTGIRTEMKTRGSGGYLPNFFIILDDPHLAFDIGRKSIPGRQLGMLREITGEAFRNFLTSIRKYTSGEPEEEPVEWEKSKEFAAIRKLPDLAAKESRFVKRPHSQEATVAALFYEQIGRGKFPSIKPLISGYKSRYDLYAEYNGSDVVIEFKYKLASLFVDFDDEKKLFDQIDIIVVWEVTESDREIIASRGLTLDPIEKSDFSSGKNGNEFHFKLMIGPVKPILVLCLKDWLAA